MFRLLTALILTVMLLGRADASFVCMTDTGVTLTEHGCVLEVGAHVTRATAAVDTCDGCIDVVVSSDGSFSSSRDLRSLTGFQALVAVIFEMLPPPPQPQTLKRCQRLGDCACRWQLLRTAFDNHPADVKRKRTTSGVRLPALRE